MKTIVALLTLIASSAAFASAPAGSDARGAEAEAATAAEEGANKVVCKREPVAGSRLAAKRVCQTAAEWERQRREDQQAAEKVQAGRWKSN